MTDTPKLLPCPFCGEDAVVTEVDREQGLKWGYASCSACGARGPDVRTDYDTGFDALWRASAGIEWNRRHAAAVSAARADAINQLLDVIGTVEGRGAANIRLAARKLRSRFIAETAP